MDQDDRKIELSEKEATRRMDNALRRALSTPPQPRHKKPTDGGSKAVPKPYHKAKRGK